VKGTNRMSAEDDVVHAGSGCRFVAGWRGKLTLGLHVGWKFWLSKFVEGSQCNSVQGISVLFGLHARKGVETGGGTPQDRGGDAERKNMQPSGDLTLGPMCRRSSEIFFSFSFIP
jgi:hypothetical protein